MARRSVDADVVVVGGGPAGSAAAIACATRGLRVILCERERPGRDRPGETMHPGVEPLLEQLGIADRMADSIGARHPGIWIEWGGPRRFEAFGSDASGPWSGFQFWRADFDALLVERAREVGADVRQPCAVTRTLMRDGKLEGVETAGGLIRARMVVDATGATRWLGRTLGVNSQARSPRLIARYGYMDGSCPAYDDAPSLVGDRSGWTWTALVRPELHQWTRVSFDGPPRSDWTPPHLSALTPRAPQSRRRRHVADGRQGGRHRLVHGRRRRGDARPDVFARRAQGNHFRHDGRPSDCGCARRQGAGRRGRGGLSRLVRRMVFHRCSQSYAVLPQIERAIKLTTGTR